MALFPASERFWAASEAWTNARRATPGAKSGSLDRTEARWRISAAQYLRGTPSLAARAWIYPGPEAARDAARLIEGIAPQVQEVMDAAVAAQLFDAWNKWPVRSGFSKSQLTAVWRANGPELTATIVSPAPYTTFIKSTDTRATTLLDRAGQQAQAQIIERLSATDTGAK